MAGHGTKSLLMTPSIKQYFIYYELETLPEEFIVSEVGKRMEKNRNGLSELTRWGGRVDFQAWLPPITLFSYWSQLEIP